MQKIKPRYTCTVNLKIEVKSTSSQLFKWKHFESEIIMLCGRWYLKYPHSYRMLVEMIQERVLKLTHTTIMRWVHQYSPIIDERVRKYLKPPNDSWRMDETYLKIKGEYAYLYRVVDSAGNTIDFFVSGHSDKEAATEVVHMGFTLFA